MLSTASVEMGERYPTRGNVSWLPDPQLTLLTPTKWGRRKTIEEKLYHITYLFRVWNLIYRTLDDILLTGSQVCWLVECGNCGGFEFMRGSIRGKAPRSVSAHRSRGGYWGAIWTRCGIQSGLITIFTSSTWYLTTHESQIFQVSIPAFTALKESCKQATLFYIILLQFLWYIKQHNLLRAPVYSVFSKQKYLIG